MISVVGVDCVGLDGEFGLVFGWAFFEGERSIAIDSDKCLCCLSWNPTLRLEAISLSLSFLQIIWGTNWFTHASTLSLEDEKDREYEGDEEDDEDGGGSRWSSRIKNGTRHRFLLLGRMTDSVVGSRMTSYWSLSQCSL